jgi:hypothetical protein
LSSDSKLESFIENGESKVSDFANIILDKNVLGLEVLVKNFFLPQDFVATE